ncbi:MAG: hypothetical protein FWG91_03870 [Lachnospiraceae bacterium]|nr:hypothetical protein [Lachnospiraceae bacterium]
MLIVFYTTAKYKNLLDLLPGNHNKKIFEGQYYLEELLHQKQNLVNATDFIFLRGAFREGSNDDFLESLKGFTTLYPEKRVTIVLQGEDRDDGSFIPKLVRLGIYNIATSLEVNILREEVRECVSTHGMGRYRPKAVPAPLAAGEAKNDSIMDILMRIEAAVMEIKGGSTAGPLPEDAKIAMEKINFLRNENESLKSELLSLKEQASSGSRAGDVDEPSRLENQLAQNDAYIKKLIEKHSEEISSLSETIEKLANELENSEGLRKYHEKKSSQYDDLAEGLESQGIKLPEKQAAHDFSCENIHIGFFGTEARAGVTNTALALCRWLALAGGTSAYAEENLNNHCSTFNAENSSMESAKTDFGYSWEGVDIYLRTIKDIAPKTEFPKDYNFVIHDFGKAKDVLLGEAKEGILGQMDVLVLVGGFKGYERDSTLSAFRSLKHMGNLVLALNFIKDSYHEQLAGYLKAPMEGSVAFIDYMPDPEFPLSNQKLFSLIIKNYI